MAAVVQPRDRLLTRVAALGEADGPLCEAGLGREDAIVDLLAPRRRARRGCGAARAPPTRPSARAPRRAPPPQARRSRRSGSPRRRRRRGRCAPRARSPPSRRSATRTSSARTRSPRSGSVSSRKSSCPRRRTTSGAITRAFGVSSSASHDSPGPRAAMSFETIRSRYSSAAGPETRTKERGRNATRIPGYCRDGVQVEGGKEGDRGGLRPRPAAARPVPDREVAGAPRRLDPVDRPRDVDVRGLRRGRESGSRSPGTS